MSTRRPGTASASRDAAAALSTPTRRSVRSASAASREPRLPDAAHNGYAMKTLGHPPSANSSASASVATVTPVAPCASCRWAICAHLWVFACGRSATPAAAAAAAIPDRLRSSCETSITTDGVSRSSGISTDSS